MKNKQIKRGDLVVDHNGYRGIIADIQYEHNRYQYTDVSGWKYDISNLKKVSA